MTSLPGDTITPSLQTWDTDTTKANIDTQEEDFVIKDAISADPSCLPPAPATCLTLTLILMAGVYITLGRVLGHGRAGNVLGNIITPSPCHAERESDS